jgi:hypothetical protein
MSLFGNIKKHENVTFWRGAKKVQKVQKTGFWQKGRFFGPNSCQTLAQNA